MVLDHFFARPDLPEAIRQIEDETRYYTTLHRAWRSFVLGLPDEVIHFLKKSIPYSPRPGQTGAIFSWAEDFSRWNVRDGGRHDRLQMSWPYFKRAISMDETQWQSIERLLSWRAGMELHSRGCQFGSLAVLWRYSQKAIQLEEEIGLPVEKMLEWWVNAWWFYWTEAYEQAFQGLSVLNGLSSRKIVDLVKMTIPASPGPVRVNHIARLWSDLRKKGYVHPSNDNQATALYLTVFGQAAMARQWRVALDGLTGALRAGFHPEALRAWHSFIRAALVYFL